MLIAVHAAPCARTMPRSRSSLRRADSPLEISMIWETPVAIDLRFGMEITMYVSHR